MSKRVLECPPHCDLTVDGSGVGVYYDPKRYCRAILPKYDPFSVAEDRGDTLVKVTLRDVQQTNVGFWDIQVRVNRHWEWDPNVSRFKCVKIVEVPDE